MTLLPAADQPATQTVEPIISVQGVTKRFGSHTVLKDVTFDVPRGKTSAVLGPSGTGKSVLLKVIIGLLRPEEGQILIEGEPMVGVPERDVLRIRRKFGVLFQDGALFGSMPLYDNIAFPLVKHTKKSPDEIREIVMAKSELVGLGAHLRKLPSEVSGGMRKRAGLARALVLEPRILFFDEPDSGLDPVRVAYLDDLVNTVQAETGSTFFIITHNIESVRRTADYFGVLFRSKLVAFGEKSELSKAGIPVVDQFLAGRTHGPISMDEMADAETARPDTPADGGAPQPALAATAPVPTVQAVPAAAVPAAAAPAAAAPRPPAGPGAALSAPAARPAPQPVPATAPAAAAGAPASNAPGQTPATVRPTQAAPRSASVRAEPAANGAASNATTNGTTEHR
jgi:phospholipid/cholesterol/gamma-HCH transport system ATP-binding protein